ncbi:MAG: outer membrane protein transport protein [Pseudomonadota bacterium]
MKQLLGASAAIALGASGALAGGIDRSNQPIGAIFNDVGEQGYALQLSLGNVSPEANGTYGGGAASVSDPLSSYNQAGAAVKKQISDQLSLSLIYDQPFGANVNYQTGIPFFGGKANIDSDSFTALALYKLDSGFSVYGGVRSLSVGGEIFTVFSSPTTTPALLEADSDTGFGLVGGVAYERPDIALRVALTYSSEIDLTFSGTESTIGTIGGIPNVNGARAFSQSTTFDMTFPESVNLDFQSGVAEDTLLFGSIRWAGWGGFNLTTDSRGLATKPDAAEYVRLDEDTYTFNLGVGRRITDEFSMAVSYTYEDRGNEPSTTALAPTTGLQSITIAGNYDAGNGVTISGGITIGEPGKQIVENGLVGDVTFDDNKVRGVGVRIGYAF